MRTWFPSSASRGCKQSACTGTAVLIIIPIKSHPQVCAISGQRFTPNLRDRAAGSIGPAEHYRWLAA
jgi:hypothetical protein